MRWFWSGGVLIVAVIAACAAPSPPPTAESSSQPLPSLSLDPGQVGLSCGDALKFHPALLAVPGQAEQDADPAAAALRAYLASPDGAGEPRSGWVRVGQLATSAVFLAPVAEAGPWALASFVARDGGWQPDSSGRCTPEIVLPAGVGRAEWRVDPAHPPGAADRELHLLINELACTGGQSPEGRVLPPIVATSPDAISIAILVRDLPGGHDCPGNPDFSVTVSLPDPFGPRRLLDAAVFPPSEIGQAEAQVRDYELRCGAIERQHCEALAEEVVRQTELETRKQVVSVEVTDELGSYQLLFDDGSGVSMIVN